MLKCIALIGAIIWFMTLLFVYKQIGNTSYVSQTSIDTSRNWRQVLKKLDDLQQQNDELKEILKKKEKTIQTTSKKPEVLTKKPDSPSVVWNYDFETTRRLLDDRINEVFYTIRSQNLSNSTQFRLEQQLLSLMGLSSKLEAAHEDTRYQKRAEIAQKITRSIEALQNSDDCGKARALICNLDKECGFGCQLHHVTYCAITAFATSRMLVLKNNGNNWKYSSKGWKSVFKPITNCDYFQVVGDEPASPFSELSPARVVTLGIIDTLQSKLKFLPKAVPSSIIHDLSMVHSHPPAFFIGCFISYLMRFNEQTAEKLEKSYKQIPSGPIVGLQVRRTDKIGTEAAFHNLSEYMLWAEYWYQSQERRLSQKLARKVFIASDDPSVVPEATKNYPNYEVFGSIEIANTAQLNSRYSDSSLLGVITDIYILSKVDYIVCTFSSQVCRMGYELRQPYSIDDGSKFHSLDDIYYFGGQQAHEVMAIEDHMAENRNEISLNIGDRIGIAGNHWNGYSKGVNRRTGANGIFPSYKVVNDWRTYNFKSLLM